MVILSRHKTRPNAGRNVRLADQIQKDLATIVQRELDVAQVGLVTLTGVDLSADYAHAKVYFTVLGADPELAHQVLNEKAGWLHSQLFKLLHIHTVPSLRFIHDEQLAKGIELSQLIDTANRPQAGAAVIPELEDPDDETA